MNKQQTRPEHSRNWKQEIHMYTSYISISGRFAFVKLLTGNRDKTAVKQVMSLFS